MARHRVRTFIGVLAVVIAIGVLPAGAGAQEEELPAVGVETIAQGLTSPVALVPPGDGSGRLFVVDQAGVIRVLAADGTLLAEPFLDLRSRMVSLMPAPMSAACWASRSTRTTPERPLLRLLQRAAARGRAGRLTTPATSPSSASPRPPERRRPGLRAHPAAGRPAAVQPQRRHLAVRPRRRLPVHLARATAAARTTSASATSRTGTPTTAGGNGQDVDAEPARQDPADRRRRRRRRTRSRPTTRSSASAGLRRDLGVRLPQPVAHVLRPGRRPRAVRGRRRPEPVGGGRLVARGGNYGWNVKEGDALLRRRDPSPPPAALPRRVGAGHPTCRAPLIDPSSSTRTRAARRPRPRGRRRPRLPRQLRQSTAATSSGTGAALRPPTGRSSSPRRAARAVDLAGAPRGDAPNGR